MEAAKTQLQKEVTAHEKLQNDTQKYLASRQMLDAQLTENKTVDEELKLMPKDGKVYKLVGPVLVRQSPDEAKSNVDKRIKYIQAELKRQEDCLADLEKKKCSSRDSIEQLQRVLSSAKS